MTAIAQAKEEVAQVSDMEIEYLLMSEILSDEKFNCRGYIPPSDVVDLARDIADNGLQNPILVQPWTATKGKKFRIVSGHRRHAAYTINKSETIPCIVKRGLTEAQALILNLGENTNRKQLNILQEAKALARLKNSGLGQSDIASALKVPRPWVQTRFYVLDFPEDIQTEIADGYIVQAQIHQIHALPQEEWYEAVRAIKDAKIRAGTKRLKVKVPKKAKAADMLKAEPRDTHSITAMLDHITDCGEPGLHTRALAWAAGNITTLDFLKDFQKYVKDELNEDYKIPSDGIDGL